MAQEPHHLRFRVAAFHFYHLFLSLIMRANPVSLKVFVHDYGIKTKCNNTDILLLSISKGFRLFSQALYPAWLTFLATFKKNIYRSQYFRKEKPGKPHGAHGREQEELLQIHCSLR